MVPAKIRDNTVTHVIAYCYATLFSPVLLKLLEAVRVWYHLTFLGHTTEITGLPPTSIATDKAHIDQVK
jgi:hypothetical protein